MRMNSGTAGRARARRLGAVAALAAGVLGATAATAAAAPSATVTPASNIDPAGQTVTIRGRGFLAPDVPSGLYVAQTAVVDGTFVVGTSQKWVTTGTPGSPFQVRLNTDGTFETTIDVTKTLDGGRVDCAVVQCFVTTWPERSNPRAGELYTHRAITFAGPAPGTPSITVAPTVDVPREGETTLEISGTGFDPSAANANGFYIGYGPRTADFWLNASTFGATKWVQPGATPSDARATLNIDGSFRTTLTISPSYTTRGGTVYDCRVIECAILTFAAQGSADRSQDTTTPITFAPPPPVAEVSPTTGLNRDAASRITVRGSRFAGDLYVSLTAIVKGEVITDRRTARSVSRTGTTPEEKLGEDGTFATSLTINPVFTSGTTTVDCRVTQCAISTFRARTNPTPTSLWTSTPLEFARVPGIIDPPIDPPRPQPAPEATVTKVKAQTLGSKRGARVGFVTCKVDCAVSTPKSVKVKIGKKKYTAKVVAPKSAQAGKRVQIRVTLTKAAAKALAGRSAKVAVNVKLTANGQTETKKVSATVKAKKAKKAAKKPAAKPKATAKR